MSDDLRRPARRGFSRVVFVDFDHVLNNNAWLDAGRGRELSPDHIARLDTLCRGAGAAVVVVSGWRYFTRQAELAALLAAAGLTAPVLGAVGCDRGEDDGRVKHAAAWLAATPTVRSWVVLDDGGNGVGKPYTWTWRADKDGPDLFAGRWVRVDGAHGLTDADVSRAAAMLRRDAR